MPKKPNLTPLWKLRKGTRFRTQSGDTFTLIYVNPCRAHVQWTETVKMPILDKNTPFPHVVLGYRETVVTKKSDIAPACEVEVLKK